MIDVVIRIISWVEFIYSRTGNIKDNSGRYDGKARNFSVWASITKFCKIIEIPIALISAESRG